MDAKDVERLFELAKIEATEEELAHFPRELDSILGYVSKLKEAPLGDIPPLLSIAPEANIVREDISDNGVFVGREAFPETENGFLKTKKVFGNG